jgi:hypothetical protein
LYAAHQIKQSVSANQLNWLSLGEMLCVGGVGTHGNDLHSGRLVVSEKTKHFPHHLDVDALRSPALALHECQLAILAELQVDATVCASLPGFLHGVALPPECLPHQQLELAPT